MNNTSFRSHSNGTVGRRCNGSHLPQKGGVLYHWCCFKLLAYKYHKKQTDFMSNFSTMFFLIAEDQNTSFPPTLTSVLILLTAWSSQVWHFTFLSLSFLLCSMRIVKSTTLAYCEDSRQHSHSICSINGGMTKSWQAYSCHSPTLVISIPFPHIQIRFIFQNWLNCYHLYETFSYFHGWQSLLPLKFPGLLGKVWR